MPTRPAIPADLARTILIESGHRCAVCGTPNPLERAHIIPWRRSKEHKLEDLICLCANCHQRADNEEWGTKTLRQYKIKPWVMRQNNSEESVGLPAASVTILIGMDFEKFDDYQENLIRHALAGLLRISPGSVRISSKKKCSIEITLELPASSARELLERFDSSDPELQRHLAYFRVRNIRAEDIAKIGDHGAASVEIQDAEIARLLKEWSEGDPGTLNRIVELTYEDLHNLAARTVARERPRHTLQATALLNELYFRLIQTESVQWKDRRHFLIVASDVMRRVLVDHARVPRAAKRGSGLTPPKIAIKDILEIPTEGDIDILALDEALSTLKGLDPMQSKLVELRFFVGLTIREIAEELGISPATVKRKYKAARLWLLRELRAT